MSQQKASSPKTADPFSRLELSPKLTSSAGRRIRCGAAEERAREPDADMVMTTLADVVASQRRLEAMVRQLLAADAARRVPQGKLCESDRDLLATVLEAVAGDVGDRGRYFTARDAAEGLAQRAPDALQALGGEGGQGAAKRLGKLLARGDGHVVAGLLLRRYGELRGSAIWQVSRV